MPENDTTAPAREVFLGGQKFSIDELTLNDLAEIEERFGESFEELFEQMRTAPLLHIIWCIRRKSDPELTLEQVGEVTVAEMMAEKEGAGDPPTEADAPAPKKSGKSGARGSRASTGSAPGKSAS